jgi:hypothetical protein
MCIQYFRKYHITILLENFTDEVDREDILKLTIGSENLHEISHANGVKVANFATSKNLTVKSIMFSHLNIHKFAWISPDGKIHCQINHRRR